MDEAGPSDRELVAIVLKAFTSDDPDAALALIHPDCVWTPTVWSGASTLRGRDAVGRWLSQFGPGIKDLRVEVEEVIGDAGWVVVLGTVFDTRGGGTFTARVGWNFAVEEGLLIEGRSYMSWDEARRAGGLD